MKFLKKAVSALLAAVTVGTMLFAGNVTAGAEETAKTVNTPHYVTYKESSEGLVLTIYGFSGPDSFYANNITLFFDNVRFPYPLGGVGHTDSYKREEINFGEESVYRLAYRLTIFNGYHDSFSQIKNASVCSAKFRWLGEKSGNALEVADLVILPFGEEGSFPPELLNPSKKDISTLEFSKISNKACTGKERKPPVTVRDNGKKLKERTDYFLTYNSNTWVGTASVTVRGNGFYSGEKTLTFKIVPPKTNLTAKRSGDEITLSWDKVKGVSGGEIQIYYREKGESKYKRLVTVSGSKTSYSTSKLDKSKTYQFKIRSYVKSNGEKIYSKFSKVKTVASK